MKDDVVEVLTASKAELSLNFFDEVLFHGKKVFLSDEVIEKVQKSFDFLEAFSKDKLIYGITTGFGPMAQYSISDTDRIKLQYKPVVHLENKR